MINKDYLFVFESLFFTLANRVIYKKSFCQNMRLNMVSVCMRETLSKLFKCTTKYKIEQSNWKFEMICGKGRSHLSIESMENLFCMGLLNLLVKDVPDYKGEFSKTQTSFNNLFLIKWSNGITISVIAMGGGLPILQKWVV